MAVVRWLVNRGVRVNAPGVMDAAGGHRDVEDYLVGQGGIRVKPKNENPDEGCKRGRARYVLCEIPDDSDARDAAGEAVDGRKSQGGVK